MQQRKILELLIEAAQSGDHRRRNEIQCELSDATYGGDAEAHTIHDRAAGMRTILDHLYVDTLKRQPSYLPKLLPVFALLCGDRDSDSIIAEIDWSLIS